MFKLLGVVSILVFLISIFMMVIFIILKVVKKDLKYNKNLKISLLTLIGSLVITIFSIVMDNDSSAPEKPVNLVKEESEKSNTEVKKEIKEEIKEEIVTEKEKYTPELKAEVSTVVNKEKNTVLVTINANTPDGAIFNTYLITGKLKTLSNNIIIKDGIGKYEFLIPKEWGITYIAGTSIFRFNDEETKQPEEVKKLYGEYGEKMKGSLAVENHLKGYNGNLEIKPFGFPSMKDVEKESTKLFNAAIKEIINLSDGIILKIDHSENDNIKIVDVIVSDAWYQSENYEKERFAEQIANTIKTVYINTGKSEEGNEVMIYFLDSYNKRLASPKIFGGYKIER